MESRQIAICLLVLRLTIFLVMLIWTIDKFVRPEHARSVYEHFYFLPGFGATIVYAIGVAELLLLVGFVIGFASRVTLRAGILAARGLDIFVIPPISASVRRLEYFVLCRLAHARRLFRALLPSRSRHAFERSRPKCLNFNWQKGNGVLFLARLITIRMMAQSSL
jgi:hypothetical protein